MSTHISISSIILSPAMEIRPPNTTIIRRVGLLTVEGETDDISGIGQTLAGQDLCQTLPHLMKANYLQENVGHYGERFTFP